MNNDLEQLAAEAKQAVISLKELQKQFMARHLTYDDVQRLGKPLVAKYNKYAKQLAVERKMPYKPITLGYFLR